MEDVLFCLEATDRRGRTARIFTVNGETVGRLIVQTEIGARALMEEAQRLYPKLLLHCWDLLHEPAYHQ